MKKLISLAFLISFITALFLVGCEKEKMLAPIKTGSAGTCELLDKLPKDLAKPLAVNYGNRVKLLGVTVNKESQDKLKASYYWQLIDDLEAFNTVFVHFTDKNNKSIFQNDHPFCQQKTFEELKGKLIRETFTIAVPKNAIGQEISVKIGLYSTNPKTGGRLKMIDTKGIPTDEENTRALIERLKL